MSQRLEGLTDEKYSGSISNADSISDTSHETSWRHTVRGEDIYIDIERERERESKEEGREEMKRRLRRYILIFAKKICLISLLMIILSHFITDDYNGR